MKNTVVKEIELNVLSLREYIEWLENGEERAYADNGPREVEVVNWCGGRYNLKYNGEWLNETDDAYAAVWYLKTGEWVAKSGRMWIDMKEVGGAE